MRVLVIVTAGYFPPFPEELVELNRQDQAPRPWTADLPFQVSYLDQRFLAGAPRRRRWAYRLLPVWVAQICEAYAVSRRYDVIFSWGAEKVALPLALLCRLTRRRVPFVALFGWISPRRQGTLLRLGHSSITSIILPPSLQRAHAVRRLGVPAEKLVDLPYCVDTDFWRGGAAVPANETGDEAEGDLICSAGREMRDYETLIQALAGTGIRCHIAGAVVSGKPDKWRRTVGEFGEAASLPTNVTVGPKNPVEMRDLYRRSRFVVLPLQETDTDNGITCMLEAWATGKAVICSAVDGQRDALLHEKTGMFAPVGDAQALRNAILKLWSSPAEAQRMGREARRYVEQERPLSVFSDGVARLIRAAARERKEPVGGSGQNRPRPSREI
ncbi:MAG: glycosyltransferase family 4 protein [Frankiaceae bacterium]